MSTVNERRGEYDTKTLKKQGWVAFKYPDGDGEITRLRFAINVDVNITSDSLETFVIDDGKPIAGRYNDEIGDFKIDFKQSIEWWPTRTIEDVEESDLTNDERLTLDYWQRKIAEGNWPEIEFYEAWVAPNYTADAGGVIRNKAIAGWLLRVKNTSQNRNQNIATEDGIITGTIIDVLDQVRSSELPFGFDSNTD